MQQPNGGGGDQRRLLRRLGDDGVAGGQCGGELAREDGEREVPGTDAGEDAAAVQAQAVPLAGRRSEEQTSELQSLMRSSYAVFCLKKKKHSIRNNQPRTQ